MNRFVVSGLVIIVFVAGCGYKGPLVMPEKPAAEKATTGKAKQKTP